MHVPIWFYCRDKGQERQGEASRSYGDLAVGVWCGSGDLAPAEITSIAQAAVRGGDFTIHICAARFARRRERFEKKTWRRLVEVSPER